LKLLHHPNVIEVLGSYAYRGEVNLVFRRAEGGTLADLLENPPTPAFQSNKAFLKALSGLCSAVSIVHQHVSSKTDLEMIGCHHDLKPANILVENNEFVLADFGLSNLKDAEKDSDTPARAVHPYYSPPECWQPAGSSEKPIIHRSSDVWSLGCIIAEVVTYMLDGPQGVAKFEQSRSFQDGIITRYRFHRGGKEEPAVTMWIKKMQNSASETIQMLGCLVYNTLQLEPRKRPSAHKIEQHMCFVVIHSLSSSICHLYEKVSVESQSIEAYLEQTRFMSWKYGCGIDDNYSFDIKLKGWKDIKRYRAVMESLTDIEKELNYVLGICKQSLSRIFRVLRQLNTLLIEDLPQDAQDRARTFLDVKMMASEHDLSLLANINVPEARRLAMLATVKTMTEVSKSREGKGGCIDRKRLKKVKRFEDFVICRLEDSSGVDCGPVLIESRTYEEHQAEKRIATELYERLESITAQLKTANHSEGMDGFRVLPCAGFYQDPTAYSCGIIYHFPSQSANTTFTSLRSSLEISQRKPTLQPSLEARFELALALATSLRQFHKANWFQKSVSSFNIVFCHDDTASWLDGIKNPFFLGLLYSRSNDIKAFTEGPTEEASHRDFQHPEYRKNNLRFRAEYDYFSLGLVLLEIGLWQPLSQLAERRMKDGDKESSKPFMEYILQSCVPRLALTMGTRYRKVVQTCLNGDFGAKGSSKDEVVRFTNIQLRFSDLVVETLAKCSV
jgi:serine/threonine protein kinase